MSRNNDIIPFVKFIWPTFSIIFFIGLIIGSFTYTSVIGAILAFIVFWPAISEYNKKFGRSLPVFWTDLILTTIINSLISAIGGTWNMYLR